MPIHSCTLEGGGSGFQWGGGHCYGSREGAEKQAQAAYASGYTGDDGFPAAAGVVLRSPAGRLLFVRRGPGATDHEGAWAWPGGMGEAGEDAEETARRELNEETGYDCGELRAIDRRFADGLDFSTFIADCADEFEPTLNDEHTEYAWAVPDQAPQPLHPGVAALLANDASQKAISDRIAREVNRGHPVKQAVAIAYSQLGQDALIAFDQESVRNYDNVGRLHVARTPISKANICPYKGEEIPNWEQLGLDPNRIYQLLRDPEELARAAKTFNGVPLLLQHKPTSANEHPKALTIGAVGTGEDAAEYEHPYLYNSLSIWPADAIQDINSNEKKQLSAGYHYTADMTPGVYEGVAYDGVMRNIVGNHVAIVKDGRAGTDVVVGDSKENLMTTKVLTRKAVLLQGAITAYLRPKLAQDQKIDLMPALTAVTAKNFKGKKPTLVAWLGEVTKGKLAQDADLQDLDSFLDAMGGMNPEEAPADAEMVTTPSSAVPISRSTTSTTVPTTSTTDADPLERIKQFLKGKITDEDMAHLDALHGAAEDQIENLGEHAAEDEDDEDDKPPAATDRRRGARDRKMGKDQPPDFEGKPKEPEHVTKGAMDQAIREAVARSVAGHKAMREAERIVRPWVGDLALAQDSAEEVYKTALNMLGVKTDGIHSSAFRALLEAQPKPGGNRSKSERRIAQDAAQTKSFAERFPGAARINI